VANHVGGGRAGPLKAHVQRPAVAGSLESARSVVGRIANRFGISLPRQRRRAPRTGPGTTSDRPRCRRMRPTTAVSRIRATSVIRPAHRGHASTSKPKLRSISSAHARFGRRPTRPPWAHARAASGGPTSSSTVAGTTASRHTARGTTLRQGSGWPELRRRPGPPGAPGTRPDRIPTASSRPPTDRSSRR